jgi:hypothetical protein
VVVVGVVWVNVDVMDVVSMTVVSGGEWYVVVMAVQWLWLNRLHGRQSSTAKATSSYV